MSSNENVTWSAICFTCGGLQRVTNPRLYQIQVDENLTTGMTMGEWKTCPQCNGSGHLPPQAPV